VCERIVEQTNKQTKTKESNMATPNIESAFRGAMDHNPTVQEATSPWLQWKRRILSPWGLSLLTTLIVLLMLLIIQPPLVQSHDKRDAKKISIVRLLFWSLLSGAAVLVGPRLISWISSK
jgi:hypothetical protein